MCDEYPQIQCAQVSVSSSLVVTLLRDIPSTNRGTKSGDEGAEVKTGGRKEKEKEIERERDEKGDSDPPLKIPL